MGLRVIYTQEEAPIEPSERPIEVIAPIIEDHGEADIAVEPANSFPELPIGHLQRFAQLLAAARACDFAVVHVRIDGDGISMELSAGPAN
ncbi:hypothetical protein EKN06_04020 [Croceicoccus ponticola]|uniref:Uncharacterized protein n=1 Tax=Croceicoccus ponticola TaxID=2217664 RepID=A0A437H196_9SPHN|nr:hypothetical protein [Croceicoccus ponticola]RVQ69359.1 hypothetical protein EKN06_04020 [Croceicoccus ponticola]